METKPHHLYIGAITLGLITLVLVVTLWLASFSEARTRQYDIFFKQSVDGVSKGTAVTFSGVPAGSVKEIMLWKPDPRYVLVRIAVNEDTPILKGTTATLASSGFTGPTQIQLSGSIKGEPEITDIGAGGYPVIPSKITGLSEALNNSPLLVEKLTDLTTKLGNLVGDKNQASIAAILINVQQVSKQLTAQAPLLSQTIDQTRTTIKQTGDATQEIGRLAASTRSLIDEDGKPLLADIRKAVQAANRSADALQAAVNEARPGLKTLSGQSIPEATQLIHDLRTMAQSLAKIADRVNQEGGTGIVSPPQLPEYKGKK
jgi:phospholipid/cholesterol/gamma-HCH transport system substrate-binding protein